jgi:hypothetical protein
MSNAENAGNAYPEYREAHPGRREGADPLLLADRKAAYAQRFVGYVDLSAKLEQWTKDSIVVLSNGSFTALRITKESKQQARQVLVERYGRRTVRYRLLAILIYLLIQDHLEQIDTLYIDRDYEGAEAEATIKNLLLHLLRRNGYERQASFVHFANVRGSVADTMARRIYLGKESPPTKLTWEAIHTQIQKLGKVT